MCPRLPSARRALILPELNAAMERYGITTVHRTAAFMANVMKESQGFLFAREIWGPTPAQKRYEGRHDLGNTQPGDGFKFRGRGFIQTTGRANYRKVGRELGVDLEAQPELLEQPKYAALSAAFFWQSNRLNQLADCLTGRRDASEQKTLTAICRRINGGTNGLSERVAFYWRALSVLNSEPAAALASAHLTQAIAANPIIPTPETHTRKQIDAERANPTQAVADAEVKEQSQATHFIDVAEATPPSVLKAQAASLWSRVGVRVAGVAAWMVASLKAGDFSAWLMLALVAAVIVYLVASNRRDLKRWQNVGLNFLKESFVGS